MLIQFTSYLKLQVTNFIFDAEQVYLKLQATNFKNKEVIANHRPQILEKNGLSKILTLNPTHKIRPKSEALNSYRNP